MRLCRIDRVLWAAAALGLLWQDLNLGAAEQAIPLDRGWNLITVQVSPDDPSPAAVFGSANGLVSVWAFDNVEKFWRRWQPRNNGGLTAPGGRFEIDRIRVGQALWLETTIAHASFTISGSVPSVAPPVELTPGWNLVGIPMAGPGAGLGDDKLPILSVLALPGLRFDTLASWQSEAAASFVGAQRPGLNVIRVGSTYPGNAGVGNIDEFRFFDPNRAYWLRVDKPTVIQPRLVHTVRSDADVPPLGNFPGVEDLNISETGNQLEPTAQRRIVFRENEETQQLNFSNEGGGVLHWELEWVPEDPELPQWMSLSTDGTSPGDRVTLTGTTTIGTEQVVLRLDRAKLPRGTYRGDLRLRSSAEPERVFKVVANVGGIQGEWSGSATITSVAGKRNQVPDIGLNLSFFQDGELLRGAIDSSKGVLWPFDVNLIGHLTGNGNGFRLGGAYVLPPGDQNNQPYGGRLDADANDDVNSEAPGRPHVAEDVDWDNDGVIDAADRLNPFPFPIYRSVFLDGELKTASPVDNIGFTIEGDYQEVIYGMLRDPIVVEGRFRLSREDSLPFSSLRQVAKDAADPFRSVAGGAVAPAALVRAGGIAVERKVSIQSDLRLHDMRVAFELRSTRSGTPLSHSLFSISLQAPDGRQVTLHDSQDISPAMFREASYPDRLTPLDPNQQWKAFVSSVSSTVGDWTLRIVNRGDEDVSIQNVRLTLVGQAVMNVVGRVVSLGPDGAFKGGVAGADIDLVGLPIATHLRMAPGADGTFMIEDLPAMPVNLSAQRPGYAGGTQISENMLRPDFSADNDAERRLAERFQDLPAVPPASLGVSGFTSFGSEGDPFEVALVEEAGGPELLAVPPIGSAALEVQFWALRTSGEARWDFGGDGVASGAFVTHTFERPGVYPVTLTHSGGTLTKTVVVMQAPGRTVDHPNDLVGVSGVETGGYESFVFQPRFSSGGSLPLTGWAPQESAEPLAAELVMIQHTYAASADIDLAPFTTDADRDFGNDGFASGGPYSMSPLNQTTTATDKTQGGPGWKNEDHNYYLWLGKWLFDGQDVADGVTEYVQNDDRFDPPKQTGFPEIDDPAGAVLGFDLSLLSPESLSELPLNGQSLVVVARFEGRLHFRIFNSVGVRMLDGDDRRIEDRERVRRLRTRLQPLWDQEMVSPQDSEAVIQDVTNLFGLQFNYYRMACNIGATIIDAGVGGASVRSASLEPPLPPLEPGPASAGVSANRFYRMTVSPFHKF